MTYYLADANGYLDDFATITGLKEFREWAEQHHGPIRDFVYDGDTDSPQALADALEQVSTTGYNEGMRSALAKAARRADGVLIITDGANNALDADGDDEAEDDGGFETWPTPASEIDPEALAAAEAADEADGIADESFMTQNQLPGQDKKKRKTGREIEGLRRAPMRKIEVFTWGYWGWGSETKSLVKAADAVEAKRSFKPPVFVDIRIRRTVRAKGFSGRAFEDQVGSDRYVWLRGLGNDAILTGEEGVKIHDRAAAAELLTRAIDADRDGRRILFFCACEFPGKCHRKVVAKLLIAEAKRRRVALVVDEWPGGDPVTVTVPVSQLLLKQVSKGRKTISLGKTSKQLALFAGLPRGSVVEVCSAFKSVGARLK